MSETGSPDAWHEKVIENIRADAADKCEAAGTCPEVNVPAEPVYNWPEVRSQLTQAAASRPDDKPPSKPGLTDLIRAAALFMRRLALFLLRFCTVRMGESNRGVLLAVWETARATRALSVKQREQGQEIRRLHERLTLLEAHLARGDRSSRYPADEIRKAS